MTITIYSRPDCQACKLTKRVLKRRGLDYHEIDLTNEPELTAELQARGHSALPVVITDTDEWHGMNPAKLRAL